MTNTLFGILLIISTFATIALATYICKTAKRTQFRSAFLGNFICIAIWNIGMIAQIFLADIWHIDPIYFDYISYIGICFLPVTLLFTSLLFTRTKIKFKLIYGLLFIVPLLSLLVLWTNDFHHLFYKKYDIILSESVFGPYLTIHSIYSYSCIVISLIMLISYIVKNAGFFSKQSFLIALGALIPAIANVIGTFGILPVSIYVTPVTYFITLICYSIALFKLNLLSISPIALQRIVDRISDSYVVLNADFAITDFNATFLKTFGFSENEIRNKNFFRLIDSFPGNSIDTQSLKIALEDIQKTSQTLHFEVSFESIQRFFNVEINDIRSNGILLGILILLKDVTEHVKDLKTIEDNQNKLMERERLASLGQLIGGIAHNLKTPIMSISGATEGLSDLVKEYDSSIEDAEVNFSDHHDIANDMLIWIDKIRNYTEYMSDVITAVKGQAVALSDDKQISFSIEELVKRVDILMRHELKNALINLKIKVEVDPRIKLRGNANSLVQVIDNMISNAIQAYGGKTNENIEFLVHSHNSSIVFTIKDWAGGLPEEVSQKLFKEMVTTKGKNGTGLGLFMSYSNIRAHFNGNITFDSTPNVGTEFHIAIPLN